MKLVIVESPAKAKTINRYLGDGYKVLASFGHVCDLPSKDGSVLPDEDFEMKWQVSDGSKKHISEIQSALKKADKLILATDPDREGEAISWHVLELLKDKKLIGDKPVERVVFNEVTKTAILKAMERETCTPRVGSVGVMARLADVLAASIVRAWVECGGDKAVGWFEALRDPRLGRAIGALHRAPGRNWTVAELAAEAGCSRSLFAERFQSMTGLSPARYLAELRMRLAAQWIEHERQPIDLVARQLGYASQAAFSRAFKRITGQSPGMMRQAAGSQRAAE